MKNFSQIGGMVAGRKVAGPWENLSSGRLGTAEIRVDPRNGKSREDSRWIA